MSTDPQLNTNVNTQQETTDVPQATLASDTAAPVNLPNAADKTEVKVMKQNDGGNLVMELNYADNNANVTLSNNDIKNPSQMNILTSPKPTEAVQSTMATPLVSITTLKTETTLEPSSSSRDNNGVTVKTPSSSTKTPSKSSSSNTPHSIISPKIPRYLIKSSNGRPTYITMVHEAIIELADRTGSSVPAIQKFMKNKHEHLQNLKPKTFNALVNTAIKAGLKEERFVKIRCSYKMNSAWVRKQKDLYRARENKKKAAEKKKKMEAEKIKAEKEKKLKEEKEKQKKLKEEKAKAAALSDGQRAAEEKKKLALLEAERKREEAQKKAQELAERIKKRRFPMDDLELIEEDKELGVKRPVDKSKHPFLPFTFASIIPFDDRPPTRKTTSATIVNACTATMSQSSRSIASDLLQVYNFFRGDVGFCRIYPNTIPEFTLNHMLHAINEVMIGNMKKSQLVPPLLSQLFHTSLDILTEVGDDDWTIYSNEEEEEINKRKCLKEDLVKLNSILDETSWGQILMCYIDLMDRFYSSDVTLDSNALPGFPITLAAEGDDENMSIDDQNEKGDDDRDFVDGYHSYIGPVNGPVNRGFVKLLRLDPWCLTAEELIALLRTLTDDILAMKAKMNETFIKRDEERGELLKNKKSTEYQFRKVRLAFEGPKYPSKSKAKKLNEENKDGSDTVNKENNNESTGEQVEKKFKPTATKQEFEEAVKARIKAIEQYDKNINNLTLRSEPVGHDRNHSAYYYFHTDPKRIHVEVNRDSHGDIKPIKSWHCIDEKVLFDSFVNSLDKRGIRENALLEQLAGEGSFNFRKFMSDSTKKKDIFAIRQKEEEDLERRLNNALIASADKGRRSGRLANGAKDEVAKIRSEMELARLEFAKQLEIHNNGPNYRHLTGITAVTEFESSEDVHTDFNKLCGEGRKASGMIDMVSSTMLDLEYCCEQLDPWDRKDISRQEWISNIENITKSYENGIIITLGPKIKSVEGEDSSPSPSKRQRLSLNSISSPKESTSSSTLSQVMNFLKVPLLELEQRIYSFSGLERAVREADEADDNGSVDSGEVREINEEQRALERAEKIQLGWKKKINSLKYIPTKRASAIRDVLIAAITIARKGNLEEVLKDLRSALNLHRPGAAAKARYTALSVLEKYGGYGNEGEEDEGSIVEDDMSDIDEDKNDDKSSEEDMSFLCTEAMMMFGCLDGDDNANRVDWKEAVNECKTLSRFAALVSALSARAMQKIRKLSDESANLKRAIKYWEMGTKTRRGKGQKKTKEKYNSATEIWTTINQTDDFVLGKVEGFPWWPATICIAKDPVIRASLEALDRVLISFIGEHHLHVVKRDREMKAFKPSVKDDESIGDYSDEILKKLHESKAMAKRIMRGRKGGEEKSFVEEKKSAN